MPLQKQEELPNVDEIDPYSTAFLFDFDGTLVEIAATPDAVMLPPQVRADLQSVFEKTAGAVAVVSGRPVSQLEHYLAPLSLPLAGVHGLDFRNPDGTRERTAFDEPTLLKLQARVADFASRHEGLFAEPKPGSVALHYRLGPKFEAECIALGHTLASELDGVEMMHGKMVVELRVGGRSKADAVSHFMAMPPFAGRMPIFVGDDRTDEDGFRRAAELGGLGIKVGPEDTVAGSRAIDIATFHSWLSALARALAERPERLETMERKRSEWSGRSGGASPP